MVSFRCVGGWFGGVRASMGVTLGSEVEIVNGAAGWVALGAAGGVTLGAGSGGALGHQ